MGVESVNSIINYSKLSKRKYGYSMNSINSMRSCSAKRNKTNYTEEEARQKAIYLVDKFKNPDGLLFYLKCAWNLTDWYIDWLVEYSFKKANPSKYFVSVANKKMLEEA